jgi:ribosome modulation factor
MNELTELDILEIQSDGYDACYKGIHSDSNPYQIGTDEYEIWFSGWKMAYLGECG